MLASLSGAGGAVGAVELNKQQGRQLPDQPAAMGLLRRLTARQCQDRRVQQFQGAGVVGEQWGDGVMGGLGGVEVCRQ